MLNVSQDIVVCFRMPTKYVNPYGKQNKRYRPEYLQAAILAVKAGKLSIRKASETYAIPYTTLNEALKRPTTKKYGGQTVLSAEEEKRLLQIIFTCADWKLPLTRKDIFCIVQDYLNTIGKVTVFKNNKPGKDWWRLFKKRHTELSEKLAENVKRARMRVTEETVREYFLYLEVTIKDVAPGNIVNYDETNFRDDPGAELVCGRRGERGLNERKILQKVALALCFHVQRRVT